MVEVKSDVASFLSTSCATPSLVVPVFAALRIVRTAPPIVDYTDGRETLRR